MKSANASADDACELPSAAADAWAEVYLDVAEKLDAEERADMNVEESSNSGDDKCRAT